MMTTSKDYFQFAYDEISESEAETSRSARNVLQVDRLPQPTVNGRKDSSTSGDCDTDLDVKRSFVLRGWGDVQVWKSVLFFLCAMLLHLSHLVA